MQIYQVHWQRPYSIRNVGDLYATTDAAKKAVEGEEGFVLWKEVDPSTDDPDWIGSDWVGQWDGLLYFIVPVHVHE